MSLVDQILEARSINGADREAFLNPDYDAVKHDPFLLPDMDKAVDRLVVALERQERIVIYGDYDVDGITATALLLDAFASFGYQNVSYHLPNRFTEGYGMHKDVVRRLHQQGCDLIVTVDNGSLCFEEIDLASSLGIDTIVTDHHNVGDYPPDCVAAVNPRYETNRYPFTALAGVGVAFKLVQAMQTRMAGLPDGHEKWLLDLVALGTVCDIVSLTDENRAYVYWGLQVLAKGRRVGLRELMKRVDVWGSKVNTQSLGFLLGPRLNAAGRMKTADIALEAVVESDASSARVKVEALDLINTERRRSQDEIYDEAVIMAQAMAGDDVLVVAGEGWNSGIVGIVASKLVERFNKPTYVLAIEDGVARGSARGFGGFDVAAAIKYCQDVITKGGGHSAAAGVTLNSARVEDFRRGVNEYYQETGITIDESTAVPKYDLEVESFVELTDEEVSALDRLEPFGMGNPEPVLKATGVKVVAVKFMGSEGKHARITVADGDSRMFSVVGFGIADNLTVDVGQYVTLYFTPLINEWNSRRNVEGRYLYATAD